MQGLTWTSCAGVCLLKRDRGILRAESRSPGLVPQYGRPPLPTRTRRPRGRTPEARRRLSLVIPVFMGRPLHLITLWNDGDSRSEHLVLSGFGKQPEM